MQRLRQLWQGRTPSERRLLVIAGIVLLLVMLDRAIIKPYRAYTERLETEIGQQAELIAKMTRVRDRGPQVEQQVIQLRQRLQDVRQHLVPGVTPTLASSQLEEHLRELASTNGLNVMTTTSLRDEGMGEFRKTTIQMTLRGGLSELGKFVAAVEYDDWQLAVSSLEVRGTYNLNIRGGAQGGTAAAPQLTVTLEVSGLSQGGQTS